MNFLNLKRSRTARAERVSSGEIRVRALGPKVVMALHGFVIALNLTADSLLPEPRRNRSEIARGRQPSGRRGLRRGANDGIRHRFGGERPDLAVVDCPVPGTGRGGE